LARVLVTDGEQRSSLAVVRSLGRAGHEVLVCGQTSKPLAGASRWCRGTRVAPDPRRDREACVRALEAIVRDDAVDIAIPLTDAAAWVVPRLREACPGLQVAFPREDAYRQASDKKHLAELAGALGVPVPRQAVLESPEADAAVALGEAGLDGPVVAKPSRSVVPAGAGLTSLPVKMVPDRDALLTVLAEYPPEAYPILLQERISGPGLGAFVLADGGRLVASFAHHRIREKPPTGGVSVYRESVPLREDIGRHTRAIVEALQWSGVAMVEFKEDAASGTPYLMEVNARFWGSLQLAIDAGVDFPALLLRSMEGDAIPEVTEYRLGVRSRWLWGEIDHLIAVLRTPSAVRATHPSLPGRLGAVARLVPPWRPGDRFEVLRAGDPRPFLRESLQWIGRLFA